MGAPELLIVAFVLCLLVLPIVVVVWVAKASGRYQRNVRLTALLTGSRELEPVGVGLRLLAFMIDLVVLGVAVGSITAVIDAAAGHQSEAAAVIVALAGWFGYFGGMETILGATLGKMALRLEVIRGDGQHPGLWAALVRSFCKFYGAFSLVGIVVTIVCITGSPAPRGSAIALPEQRSCVGRSWACSRRGQQSLRRSGSLPHRLLLPPRSAL